MASAITAGGSAAEASSAGSLFGAAFTGGAIAAVVNLLLRVGGGAAGVSFVGEFQPGQPAEALPYVPVVAASLVPAVAAALVALLLQKFAGAKAATVFAAVAVVFGLVSLGGPASVKGLDTAGVVVLSLMHVVAGASIGGFTWRRLSGR